MNLIRQRKNLAMVAAICFVIAAVCFCLAACSTTPQLVPLYIVVVSLDGFNAFYHFRQWWQCRSLLRDMEESAKPKNTNDE